LRARGFLLSLCCLGAASALAPGALAAGSSWASPEIRTVTQAGVLGTSPATFHPGAPLTQAALAQAIVATNALQHPPLPQPPAPAPLEVTSTIADGATIGGVVPWEVDAPLQHVESVDFAVDGVGRLSEHAAPYDFADGFDTHALADGQHQLAVNVHFVGGGYAIAVWSITVDNSSGADFGAAAPVDVPIVKSWLPAQPAATDPKPAHVTLYHALSPRTPVTIKQFDAALVAYLDLGASARAIQQTLASAGLRPRPNTGTEAVARLLGLRLNHPASEDSLEILPTQAASRAEAAWSFAHVLHLDAWAVQYVEQAAAAFSLPRYTPWQQRILGTAVSYVGYPYVWGGTSPTHEVEFGVPSVGGFDCSGFVWRVYKLTPYPGERDLAGVLRGRTTYQMSGEVPHGELLPAGKLQPADVMFFGAHGPRSSPNVVDHTALYLGNGWFIQSSDQGVTVLPFDGWYLHAFAWARRPLREAGLE
jgi:cell wall-associated NlpC family hydrolase